MVNNLNKLELEIFEKVFNNKSIVKNGPFKGMAFDINAVGWGGCADNLRYLMGSYEFFLWDWIYDVLKTDYDKIIDIGCANGYYLVGFAKFANAKKILGYDIDSNALKIAEKNAQLNKITSDRILFRGLCSQQELNSEAANKKTFIIADIEGAEYELLDPKKVPNLKNCDMLVELHPFKYRYIDLIFKKRFSLTHRIIKITNNYPVNKKIPEMLTLPSNISCYLDESRSRGLSTQEWLLIISKNNFENSIKITKLFKS